MDFGFNLHIDHCNTQVVIGFVCVMVMVVVLFKCGKEILKEITNNKNNKKEHDVFDFLESSDENDRTEK